MIRSVHIVPHPIDGEGNLLAREIVGGEVRGKREESVDAGELLTI
jgi:hypothetical protein